jgi:hypothetical protein
MSEVAVEPEVVDPDKVDNNIITPPAEPTDTTGPAAEAKAKADTEAKAKVDAEEAAKAKTETPETPEAAKTEVVPGPTAEQDRLNKEAAAAAAEEKKKIVDQIKKLQLDIILKGKELDQKYIAAKGDEKTQEELEVEMEAFSTETNEEIDKLYEELNGKNDQPAIIKLFSGAWNLIKLKLEVIFDKMEKAPKVTEAQLNMLKIISKNIEDIQAKGGSLDTEYAQKLSNLLLSLSKDISQTPGKSESSSKTPGTPGIMDKIEGAFNKSAAVVADPAAATKAAGLDPKASEAVIADPAAVAAVAAGGGQGGGGGGGISRKRGHPKYINQISENRNKLFKKELEIINSIRHFHRSHTIRKRDRINSILGLRKSRNNKRGANTKNTKRHRHNNHKHKSAKHIKK